MVGQEPSGASGHGWPVRDEGRRAATGLGRPFGRHIWAGWAGAMPMTRFPCAVPGMECLSPAFSSFTPVRAAPREPRSWSAGVIEDGEVLEQTIGLCQALIATANRVGRVDCFREWSFSSNGWVGDMLIVRIPPPGPARPGRGSAEPHRVAPSLHRNTALERGTPPALLPATLVGISSAADAATLIGWRRYRLWEPFPAAGRRGSKIPDPGSKYDIPVSRDRSDPGG